MFVVMKDDGEIEVGDLPPKLHNQGNVPTTSTSTSTSTSASSSRHIDLPVDGLNFNDMVSQFEKDLLLQALSKASGVKNRAAKLLNLNRTTLVEKLKRFKIMDDSLETSEE